VSFPLQQAGTAWGTNSVTGAYMTVEEAAEATAAMMDADFRWMRDHLLNAFFVDGSYTFTDDLHGALTVYGLASGDATTYNIQSGSDTEATDDHVQGTAALANATFTGLYTELLEHPENSGEVVALVSSADRAAIEALSLFYPIANPNLRPGNAATVLDANLGVSLPGDVFGMVDRVWVAEWRSMPSNYLVAFTTGGEQPVAMREDPIAELRGFNRVADRDGLPVVRAPVPPPRGLRRLEPRRRGHPPHQQRDVRGPDRVRRADAVKAASRWLAWPGRVPFPGHGAPRRERRASCKSSRAGGRGAPEVGERRQAPVAAVRHRTGGADLGPGPADAAAPRTGAHRGPPGPRRGRRRGRGEGGSEPPKRSRALKPPPKTEAEDRVFRLPAAAARTFQLRDSADYFRLGEPIPGAAGQSGDTVLPRTLSYFRLGEPLPVAR
jgi:hypothetical protein